MNIEETKKYIERRLSDLGWSVRIDKAGFQTMQKYSGGAEDRLNQLYYKLVSVGSRQEKREINGETIRVAIDDLQRMDEIVENAPLNLGQNNKHDFDRVTIEQLASSLDQKVAEEIEFAVVEAGKKKVELEAPEPSVGGNGKGHVAHKMAPAAVMESTGGILRKPRILVVDDSPTIRAAVSKALENDFEFLQGSDGEEGWRLLRAHSDIKLVVTDLMMPKMDGYDLIKRIRSAKWDARIENIPIIVVTALEDTQAKLRALVAGANDFISKSTDTLELQARVVARYQLSQIVGNQEKSSSGTTSTPSRAEMGPPPRQVAAAMLGTRTAPSIAKQAARMETTAKSQGNGGSAPKTGAAVNEWQVIPPKATASRRPSAAQPEISGWINRAIEIVAVGYRRLAQLDPTTGITLVASFLVIVTILGIIFVNRSSTKSPTRAGEIPPNAASVEGSKPTSADEMVASGSVKGNFGTGAAKDSDPLRIGATANADRAARDDKREVVRAEPGKREAPKETPAVAAAPPAGQRPAAKTATEQPTGAAAAQTPEPPPTVAANDPPAARPPVVPPPSTRLTQSDLSNLVNRFLFTYQAGDIEAFLALFDENVRTNDHASKAGLRDDYEGLFRGTATRQMVLNNIAWEINDRLGQAQGWGNFEVRVRNPDEDEPKVYRGSLTLHAEKVDGRARITRMFHGQWKAQN